MTNLSKHPPCKGTGIKRDKKGFHIKGICKECNGTGFFDSTKIKKEEDHQELIDRIFKEDT